MSVFVGLNIEIVRQLNHRLKVENVESGALAEAIDLHQNPNHLDDHFEPLKKTAD